MGEIISVVVPVYNVEKYLNRCVNSILNQTYNNLEIILVDDGSTDNSGKICDSYKSDSRVQVIHKSNGGLSSARNAALPYITGNYVTFIDSDDWIDPNMIRIMYNNAINNHAEISVVGYYMAPEDDEDIYSYFGSDTTCTVMTRKEALATYLLHDGLGVTVWGKLWKKNLWDTVKCPEGKLHEDQYTTYKLLDQANRIVFDKHPLYYYFQRSTSIGHSKFSNKTYDLYYGIREEYQYIVGKYPDLKNAMEIASCIWEIAFINIMIRSNAEEPNVIKNVQKHVRSSIKLLISSKHLNKVRKMQYLLFAINETLYKKMYLQWASRR